MMSFGSAVALSPRNHLIAIGAQDSDCAITGAGGTVSLWAPPASLTAATSSHLFDLSSPSSSPATFGNAVAFVDDSILLVADYQDTGDYGAVYAYLCTASACAAAPTPRLIPQQYVPAPSARFGLALASSNGWAGVLAQGMVAVYLFSQTGHGNFTNSTTLTPISSPTAFAMANGLLAVACGTGEILAWQLSGGVWGSQVTVGVSATVPLPNSASLSPSASLLLIGDNSDLVAALLSRNLGGQDQWGLLAFFSDSTYGLSDFGAAVAMIGETVAVVGSDVRTSNLDGAAYFYQADPRNESIWTQTFTFQPAQGPSGQYVPKQFGFALAVSSSYLLVGAPSSSIAADPGALGAAFLFPVNPTNGNKHGFPVVALIIIIVAAVAIVAGAGSFAFIYFRKRRSKEAFSRSRTVGTLEFSPRSDMAFIDMHGVSGHKAHPYQDSIKSGNSIGSGFTLFSRATAALSNSTVQSADTSRGPASSDVSIMTEKERKDRAESASSTRSQAGGPGRLLST